MGLPGSIPLLQPRQGIEGPIGFRRFALAGGDQNVLPTVPMDQDRHLGILPQSIHKGDRHSVKALGVDAYRSALGGLPDN